MTLAPPLASFSTRRQSSETKKIRTGTPKLLLAVGLACGLAAGVGPHPTEAKEWKTIRFGMGAAGLLFGPDGWGALLLRDALVTVALAAVPFGFGGGLALAALKLSRWRAIRAVSEAWL